MFAAESRINLLPTNLGIMMGENKDSQMVAQNIANMPQKSDNVIRFRANPQELRLISDIMDQTKNTNKSDVLHSILKKYWALELAKVKAKGQIKLLARDFDISSWECPICHG